MVMLKKKSHFDSGNTRYIKSELIIMFNFFFIIKVELIWEIWCNLLKTLPRLQETFSE